MEQSDPESRIKELELELSNLKASIKATTQTEKAMQESEERKKAEEALKESQNLLQKAEIISNQGSWKWDVINDEWYFSENWLKIHGFEKSKISKEELMEIAYPDDRSKIDIAFDNALRNKKPYLIEHRIIRKDNGEVRVIKAAGEVHSLDNGKPDFMIGVAQDITESKVLEDAVKESEAKHSAMISNISDIIGIIGADGIMKYKSPNIEKHFGWQPQELVGTDGFTNVHPDDLERIQEEFFTLLEKENSSVTVEYRYKCKDGSYKPIELTAKNLVSDPVINGVLLNYSDISERRKIEKALLLSSMTIESASDSIFWITPDSRIVNVNEAACHSLGYTRSELLQLRVAEVDANYNAEVWVPHFNELMKHGSLKFESLQIDKDGRHIPVEIVANYLQFEDEDLNCAFVRDITERKQIEKNLIAVKEKAEENEIQLNAILEKSPTGFAINKISTTEVTYVNQAFADAYHIPLELCSNVSTFFKYVYGNQMELGNKILSDVNSGIPEKMKWDKVPVIDKETNRTHYVSASNIVLEELDLMISTVRDITTQVENEEKLKQSDRVFNLTLDMFCIAGFDGYFKYLNPAWERTLGWSIEELLSKPWLDFVHPEDAEKTENIKSVIVDGKEIYKFENRFVSKDGSIKWLSWNSQPFPNENIMIGAARDVTEAKRIANELLQAKNEAEESERKLLEAQELSHVGNWDYTIDTDTVTWSKELFNIFERLSDLPAPQYSEQRSFYTEESFALLDKCVQDKKPYEIELDIITSNGNRKQIISKASIRRDKHNNIIGLYGTAQDITKQKNIEKDLISAKEAAENANKLKTEFLHNMSHEIRTPLNGIMGFSEMLNNPNISEEKRRNYSKIIMNSSQQLLRVIDDILEISTLETKQTKLDETEFCLNDFLMELYAIFSLKSEDRNVPVYLEKPLHDKEIQMISDKTKLNKILSNLIENAIKFTAQGSVEIGYSVENELLKLYVKDTGIGISAENQQKIFERFSQEDTDIAGTYGGLGLGLSICKENAQLLGGDITLESKKGSGSTFIVTIPYKPVSKETPDNNISTTKTPAKDKTKTILVVEDEEMNYLYIEALFEVEFELNYNLIHAKNGKEALDICMENQDIDMVLMDIKMPVMNGNEATRKIKKELPHLPIIAQTAYSTESEKRDAMKHGYDDFMSKPLVKDKLFETINKYMSIK
jgi:PAS domain S-box-containing protein